MADYRRIFKFPSEFDPPQIPAGFPYWAKLSDGGLISLTKARVLA